MSGVLLESQVLERHSYFYYLAGEVTDRGVHFRIVLPINKQIWSLSKRKTVVIVKDA